MAINGFLNQKDHISLQVLPLLAVRPRFWDPEAQFSKKKLVFMGPFKL